MKNLIYYLAAIFFVFFNLSSCNKDSDEPSVDTSYAEVESQADDTYSEVDGITESSLSYYNVGGRVAEEEDSLIKCATKTINLETRTITLDFGDGCKGFGGRIRRGMIIITYTKRLFLPGATITTTFENFYINDIKVEGTRTLTNISESLDASPKFEVIVTGGRLTWPDETYATRESTLIETWTRAANPLNDEITIEGSASGANRKGTEYSMEITTPLLLKRACWLTKAFIPVSGIKEITVNGKTMIIDYGDGTCDRMISVTVDGVTKTIEGTKGI